MGILRRNLFLQRSKFDLTLRYGNFHHFLFLSPRQSAKKEQKFSFITVSTECSLVFNINERCMITQLFLTCFLLASNLFELVNYTKPMNKTNDRRYFQYLKCFQLLFSHNSSTVDVGLLYDDVRSIDKVSSSQTYCYGNTSCYSKGCQEGCLEFRIVFLNVS